MATATGRIPVLVSKKEKIGLAEKARHSQVITLTGRLIRRGTAVEIALASKQAPGRRIIENEQ